jgi:carboxypeptidase C (cathepsin A)
VVQNEKVEEQMSEERFYDVTPVIAHLLQTKMSVLIYEGEMDAGYCNPPAVYDTVLNIPWQGKDPFQQETSKEWYVNAKILALYYKYEQLIYVSIKNAGHFANMDQPRFALDMLHRVIYSI